MPKTKGAMLMDAMDGIDPQECASQTIHERLKEINIIGKKSWLVVTADVRNYDPPRNEHGLPLNVIIGETANTPRETPRFRFKIDGFVFLEANVVNDHKLLVISNQFQKLNYPEDQAFANKWYAPNRLFTWSRFLVSLNAYVEMSNLRCKFGSHRSTLTYNPVRDMIYINLKFKDTY